jgi:hypothetical protein
MQKILIDTVSQRLITYELSRFNLEPELETFARPCLKGEIVHMCTDLMFDDWLWLKVQGEWAIQVFVRGQGVDRQLEHRLVKRTLAYDYRKDFFKTQDLPTGIES